MSGANSIDFDTLFAGSDRFAEEIANLWLEWDAARYEAKRRWKETTQFQYATSTRETVNGATGGLDYEGEFTGDEDALEEVGTFDHSTHIPKLAEIADNLSATYMRATMPHENFFTYRGLDQDAATKVVRANVESFLKSKHRSNNFRKKYQSSVDDFVRYGNCIAEVDFVSEKVESQVGGEVFTRAYVGPVLRRISPYDIVFNPLATSFEETPKIIRSIKTLGELHRDVDEAAEGEYYKDILSAAMEMRNQVRTLNVEEFDKHAQMQFDGFGTPSQYFKSGYVEILNLYGDIYDVHSNTFYKNHVITIIDRKYVVRNRPLNTYSGRPLIFHAGWRTRPDNLWAMGPLDNLTGMQFMVNHLENARADAFDQMLVPTRVEVGDVENDGAESGRPGGRYIIASGEGSVTNLAPDTTVLNADFQIDRKLVEMERFSGLPSEQVGFRTPGEKTFGEVAMLDRNASKVFKNKIVQLEGFLEEILNAELEVAKANPDFEDLVDVIGEDGVVSFVNISRADLKSNGKLVPMGARYYERQQQLVQNLQLLQQGLSQDELIKQHVSSIEVANIYAELMEMDGFGLVQPFVRVGEEAQLAKLQQAAQTQIESEDLVDVGGDVDEQEAGTNTIVPA